MKYILVLLALCLASCAVGPDWSPDVAAAANYNGSAPVYSTSGRMLGMSGGGAVQQHRSTMMVP